MFIGHAQVCAQDIDAGLPVFLPVIGQARHGVHPSEADGRRLVTAQSVGRRGEPFVQCPGALLLERSVQLLTLFRQRAAGNAPCCPEAGHRDHHRARDGNESCLDRGVHSGRLAR